MNNSFGIPAISEDEILNGVFYLHNSRSKKSKQVDNAESARLTTNVFKWMGDMNRFDFPDIDTMIRRKPSGYTHTKGKRAANKLRKVSNK